MIPASMHALLSYDLSVHLFKSSANDHVFLLRRMAKALAVMMFIIFCSYGLGMWYGAREVARDIRRGCFGDGCHTGGDVLTVFWAILQGAMVRMNKANQRASAGFQERSNMIYMSR